VLLPEQLQRASWQPLSLLQNQNQNQKQNTPFAPPASSARPLALPLPFFSSHHFLVIPLVRRLPP
jgi:hypothetical protein